MNFSTFSIFPKGPSAYFDDIFDQKIIHQVFSEIFDLKVGGYGPKVGAVILGPTREYPYTPRIDRGNTHFQIIKNIFTWLGNAFVSTGRSWKPHKWKECNFLHRNYIPKIFSTPKKSWKNFRSNFFFDFWSDFSRKFFRRKKIEKNFRSKFFSTFFRSFEIFFGI